MPCFAETSTRQRLAAHVLDLDAVLQQLGADPLRVGVRPIDLVDGDDDRHAGRLGVIDRLDRLRHHAVVGGDHQDDDVGRLGAARAHLGERLVAGRVDEGDPVAARQRHLIGADVLGDAAGLVRGDVGLAQGVEQRRLAVVDVAHDRHHRRPRLELVRFVDLALQADLDVGGAYAPDVVAELDRQQFRGVGVDDVVDGRHHPHPHQRLDHVGGTLGHPVGELLDRQAFRE